MDFLRVIWAILTSEVGQTPTDDNQVESTDDAGSQDDQTGTDDTPTQDVSGQSQNQDTEEHFIDPKDLPDEIKPHWKRMHREYNKRLKEIKHSKDKAEIYDRFYGDSQYADQVVRAWAQQNGFTLAKSGEVVQNTQQNQQQGQKAPSQLVEAFKAKLPPELHWMAESQAEAFWAAQQMMMAPLQKQQQEGQLAARNTEYDALAEELSEVAPEWEDREDEMTELLGFLTSPDMKHKKFGSKLSLLYNVLTGNAAAISQVTNRMNKGIKNKNTNGNRTIQNTKPNLADRIRKASKEDAWALAVKSAEGSE